jgi:hypothetical protein
LFVSPSPRLLACLLAYLLTLSAHGVLMGNVPSSARAYFFYASSSQNALCLAKDAVQ